MKALQLNEQHGPESLKLVDVPQPVPTAGEVLIEVKAAGVNYADYELSRGRYPLPQPLPIIMGFEAAGVVVELGPQVKNLKVGDRVATVVSSGGYAQYATANAGFAIPIPDGISFADAITIPIQGLSAYALLKIAAKPQPHETLLIQAAAGGVGLYLVQLAKIQGAKQVIALASSQKKLDLVKSLGADVVINYRYKNWPDQVKQATGGRGVDVVLEMAAGEVGEESFKLIAPFGRIVFFGAQNYHDSISTGKMRQLIFKNLTAVGFAFPTLRPDQIAECVPTLLDLIVQNKVRIFSNTSFSLAEARSAFAALSGRQTIGKIVLVP